ncbi:hypothetical protein [Pseudooctadecabacter jejudonensis]|uniref:Putative NAD(P)H nitroreductase acg n=1 Tax=Pseudooctadecabacter jejudonensis TaxID=1391910 RepID=A0A1Y5RJ98_9RHOB|nr:hypothetical protein [Pseudooctadecabacter jejudonensis]SLN17742.1 Putative NAD(P)H nitroreductase acg [Pseudooctadecabacter jejudonensis]
MITDDIFHMCVGRAGLAPTVHNTQPARWTREGDVLSLFCDTNVGLAIGDPSGFDAALSCGAVLEGMVLALSVFGIGADVAYTNAETSPGEGLVAVAHLTCREAPVDGLNTQLEQRFTWRGSFKQETANLFGWTRADTRLILPRKDRAWIAGQNDWASLQIMQDAAFRDELVGWMRLSDRHPRAGRDGMDRAVMRMSKFDARMAPLVLRHLWPMLNRFGLTKGLTAEAEMTLTAPVIALFHRDISENPVVSGRAYLRLCLEAASLGFAGWPMAALSDNMTTNARLCEAFGIGSDRRFIQAIRFGVPTGDAPPRARRPLAEVVR